MSGRIAVGVSGQGSNLRALHAAAERGELGGEIVVVFADRACAALDWATEQGIDTALIPAGDDVALAETLGGVSPDAIVLAGYMRVIDSSVVGEWRGRMINLHPSLLPKYPGLRTHERVLAAGDKLHGASVHYVTAELDGGPLIAQVRMPVGADDTAETLAARLRPLERQLLIRVVDLISQGRLALGPKTVELDGQGLAAPIQI